MLGISEVAFRKGEGKVVDVAAAFLSSLMAVDSTEVSLESSEEEEAKFALVLVRTGKSTVVN